MGTALGGAGHVPLRPHQDPGRDLLDRHAAARPSAARSTSATSSATPTPTPSPASSACGAKRSSTRWGGTTTACPPSAGSRTTTASSATRRSPTTPTSAPPDEAGQAGRPASRRRNFVELCELPDRRSTRRRSRTSGARLGLSVDWDDDLHHHRRPRPAGRPAGLPAQPGPRRGLPGRGARPVGRRLPHGRRPGRARGPRDAGRLPPHPVPPGRRRAGLHRDHPARAASRPASPWSPTPTTSATSRCSATTVRTPLFGVEVEVMAHELADPEKGSGIAMICTFGDLTDVIWWRELQLATRSVVTSNGRLLADDARVDRLGRRPGRATPSWPARRPSRPRPASSSCSRESRRARRRAPRHHPPGQVLREGRPPARDRHQPPVVHPQRRPRRRPARRAARAGPRSSHWHPSYMQVRYENWVDGLNGDWLISRQRFFGVPFPVWYRRRRRRRGRPRAADRPRPRTGCRSTRSSTRPTASTSRSGASPAASSATPTSWTPGPPRR